MVLLTMTPSIVEAITRLGEIKINTNVTQTSEGSSNPTSDVEPSLKDPSVGNPISHGQIMDIWNRFKNEDENPIRLEQLLRGATVYIPPPPPKPEPVRSALFNIELLFELADLTICRPMSIKP